MPMSRRTFVHRTLLASATLSAQSSATTSTAYGKAKPTSDDLGSTALIEVQHPRIAQLAKDITGSAQSDVRAAVLLHDWVRDEIAFGIPSGFYETTATEVLDAKVGYCNTKVTLFQALLRARSIPTRMRMMDLSAQVLQGLFDPRSPYVDHAITEVFLEDRWVKVDSYVVDKRLVGAARKKLAMTNERAGFGIHLDGKPEWDGRSDNFIQYMNNGSIKDYVLKDHGVFADVAYFYQRVPEARNRKTFFSALGLRLGYGYINQQIQKVRDTA
jgi:Transglutaminase-like superfamily